MTLSQDLGTSSAMNCPIHAATTKQRMIGRVDDRVDFLLSDIALYEGGLHSLNLMRRSGHARMSDEFGLPARSTYLATGKPGNRRTDQYMKE
jgi:hypothetical protein